MKISLCIITKNEEKNIRCCIESVQSIVDEVVVVDTGSTDNTVKIVKELGGIVFKFKWIDDFAAARNYALSKVKGDWVIFLDADEYVSKESVQVLKSVIEKAYDKNYDAIRINSINIEKDTKQFQSSLSTIRVMKKSPLIGYKGKIHENVVKIKGELKVVDAVKLIDIFHVGYSKDIVKEKKKGSRNIELLYKELEKKPNSSNIHFYLAESFNLEGDREKTLEHIRKVLQYKNGNLKGIYQKSYYYQLHMKILLGYSEIEIIDDYNQAVKFDDTYPDYDSTMGNYYSNKGEYKKAIFYFVNCIKKIEEYRGISESWVISDVKNVFKVVANLYYILNKYEEFVRYSLYILKVYKEDEELLVRLVGKLRELEEIPDILDIIYQIYDLNKLEERAILLRACIKLKDRELSQKILEDIKDMESSIKER